MTRATSTASSDPRAVTTPPLDERIGGFLEDVDHPGPVTRAVLARYASVVADVGAPGSRRYRAAVDLTRHSPDLTPPTSTQLDEHLAEQLATDQPTGPTTVDPAQPELTRGPDRQARPADGSPLWTRKRARQLLGTAAITGQPPTPEQIEAYRPLAHAAGKPGTLRWKLAVRLARVALRTADSPVPGRAELDARHNQERQRRKGVAERRRERAQVTAHTVTERDAAAAAAHVAAVRAQTGAGPTWAELAAHLGWRPHAVAELAITELTAAGVLTHTDEHRSLDVSTGYHPRTVSDE